MSDTDSKPVTPLKATNNVVNIDGGITVQSLFSSETKEHRIIFGKSGSNFENDTSSKLKLVKRD